MGDSIAGLVARLAASVGPAVVDDGVVPDWAEIPRPRETWIDLQDAIVAAAAEASVADRETLAEALLDAVVRQPSFGPSNRLTPAAFALILEAAPDELRRWLGVRTVETTWGGLRYLHGHLWALPGPAGADWLRALADADDVRANFLFQDMARGTLPRWRDADWTDRLDVVASLPAEPRPGIVTMLFLLRPPREACPALVRVALAHGLDERDHVTRSVAGHIRAHRSGDAAVDAGLFDWAAHATRRELFRWLLELSGDAGAREALVHWARAAGSISAEDGLWLAAPLVRPAWADDDVPWTVSAVKAAGAVTLPAGRLTGGDPWWTGGVEGLPWVIEVSPGTYEVSVVTARHPLASDECAALQLVVGAGPVESWTLISGAHGAGYHVEVGVAGLGSVAAYESMLVHEVPDPEGWFSRAGAWWREIDGGPAGSLVMCSVGPQHQLCRTWVGTDDAGEVTALVTDLGLLELDLEVDGRLPWNLGSVPEGD